MTTHRMSLKVAVVAAIGALSGAHACSNSGESRNDEALVTTSEELPVSGACEVAPTCSSTLNGQEIISSTSAQVGCGQHPFVLDRAMSRNRTTDVITTVETISRKGEAILTTTTHTEAGVTTVTVDYGSAFKGIRHASFVNDGQLVTGAIDGRSIKPLPSGSDPSTTTFVDGKPAPKVKVDANTEKVIALLQQNAQQAQCAPAPESPFGNEEMLAAFPPQDNGHVSDTHVSAACFLCEQGCAYGFVACAAIVAAACTAAGPFYGICVAIGVGGCLVVFGAACNITCELTACCPKDCGSECCFAAETCLNSNAGLCCSPGKVACQGKHCCSAGETCVQGGPNDGMCCGSSNSCGSNCCDPLETCLNPATGECCPLGNVCDGVCCPFNQGCTDIGCCNNAKICGNVCCGSNQVCQNPFNGTCGTCPSGQDGCKPDFGEDICCPSGIDECGYIQGNPVCCGPGQTFCNAVDGCVNGPPSACVH